MLSFFSVEQRVLGNDYVQSNSCLINNKLKELPKDFLGGLIIGKIDESIKNLSGKGMRSKPMPDVEVKAQEIGGKQSDFYGKTDVNGYYEMKVPSGKYVVTLIDSNFYYGQPSDNKPIELSDKQCEVKNFYVVNDSRIEGKVIDSLGDPVTDILIVLIPVGINYKDKSFDYGLSQTFNKGHFSFTGLSPGLYQISLNYTEKPDDDSPYPTFFYPYTTNRDEAQIIEINYGTKLMGLVFQLPPKLKKRKLTGQVFWKNGKPAKNAEVELTDIEYDDDIFFDKIKTDANGNFEIEWFEGRKYRINAIVWQTSNDKTYSFGIADAETEVFVLNEETSKFKIVLKTINPNEKSYTRSTVRAN